MKKIFLFITALLIITSITSFASAEIIIRQQPNEMYSVGDAVPIPITIKTISGVSKIFEMELVCQDTVPGEPIREGISLGPGEEKILTPTLLLTLEEIGTTIGVCKIKMSLGDDYIFTNEFEITNTIQLQTKIDVVEFNPGESLIIQGSAKKPNGADASGLLDIIISLMKS